MLTEQLYTVVIEKVNVVYSEDIFNNENYLQSLELQQSNVDKEESYVTINIHRTNKIEDGTIYVSLDKVTAKLLAATLIELANNIK